MQLLLLPLAIWQTEAKSTRVSAQYSVSDGIDSGPTRHFTHRGTVEDDEATDDDILTKIANKRKVNEIRI